MTYLTIHWDILHTEIQETYYHLIKFSENFTRVKDFSASGRDSNWSVSSFKISTLPSKLHFLLTSKKTWHIDKPSSKGANKESFLE